MANISRRTFIGVIGAVPAAETLPAAPLNTRGAAPADFDWGHPPLRVGWAAGGPNHLEPFVPIARRLLPAAFAEAEWHEQGSAGAALWRVAEQPGLATVCPVPMLIEAARDGLPIRSVAEIGSGCRMRIACRRESPIVSA